MNAFMSAGLASNITMMKVVEAAQARVHTLIMQKAAPGVPDSGEIHLCNVFLTRRCQTFPNTMAAQQLAVLKINIVSVMGRMSSTLMIPATCAVTAGQDYPIVGILTTSQTFLVP